MDRRRLLTAAVAATLCSGIRPAAVAKDAGDAEILGPLPPLPADLLGREAQPPFPYVETSLVGSNKPSTEEVDDAYEVLANSPFGVRPIEVAQYFLAVGAGSYGEKLRPFAREWPERANPVIFHFFSATQTQPEGDVTPWCAAFLNWCLLRSRATKAEQIGKAPGSFSKGGIPFDPQTLKDHSTNNASSGSFRCWTPIADPKQGDIVVFADKGTEGTTGSCRGSGHVAFYLGTPKDGKVRVLGGNQTLPGSGGAVTIADMATGSGSRFFGYTKVR